MKKEEKEVQVKKIMIGICDDTKTDMLLRYKPFSSITDREISLEASYVDIMHIHNDKMPYTIPYCKLETNISWQQNYGTAWQY